MTFILLDEDQSIKFIGDADMQSSGFRILDDDRDPKLF